MIVCGWCEHPSTSADLCSNCGHEGPARPWIQRGQQPPTNDHRRRLAEARRTLEHAGQVVTNASLAEVLGVDPRTITRWMSE